MGTCFSVEMLNGYMVRERLGTPDLGTYSNRRIKIGKKSISMRN